MSLPKELELQGLEVHRLVRVRVRGRGRGRVRVS